MSLRDENGNVQMEIFAGAREGAFGYFYVTEDEKVQCFSVHAETRSVDHHGYFYGEIPELLINDVREVSVRSAMRMGLAI